MAAEADRHLLFGLIALQVGLIDQAQLVAAFQAWARDKSRSLAEHLADRGAVNVEGRSAVEAMVALHVKGSEADTEKAPAPVGAQSSDRERPERPGEPELTGTVTRLVTGSTDPDAQGTVSYGDRTAGPTIATAMGDGQRFKVLRRHAEGGLGAVFVAIDSELHREVALKQILDSHADDPVSRRRFVLEAEITGGLEHPGIVPVYGLGTYPDGRPFYAMRFIGGEPLKAAIERFHKDDSLKKEPGRRSLELRKLLRRFMDVCNAIDYAHSRGVLHRDLKPSNIILGKFGETLVVDWGLAKPLGKSDPKSDVGERTLLPSSGSGSDDTMPGSTLGTPGYMSPEQARGHWNRVGPRSDIYSLGATLYCLLTGRPPFEDDEVIGLLHKVQWGQFVAPRQLNLTLDPALEAVCLKAMTFAPEERYATCRALADDIERWTAGQPVSAWYEPWSRRIRRWANRSRSAAAALTAAVLVALAASTYVRKVESRASADVTSARAHAKQQFNIAMNSVELLHGEVIEHPLLQHPQFDGLRSSLVASAAETYGRLESLVQAENDQESLAALGKACYRLGEVSERLNDHAAGLAAHRKALALRRSLAYEPKADSAKKRDLVQSLIATGRLERSTGDMEAARTSGEEARDLAKELGSGGADAETVQNLLVEAYRLIALVLSETEDHEGALEGYRFALAIRQKTADARPDDIQAQIQFADSLRQLGQILVQFGRPYDAIAYLERGEEAWIKIIEAQPDVPEHRHSLASRQLETAAVLLRLQRPAEARVRCQRAVAQSELLMRARPNAQSSRLSLAVALFRLGQARQGEADVVGAAADWRRAIALLEAVSDPTGELVFIDAACHASIASLAGRGGTLVSPSERDAEIDTAMALLRRAIGQGYRNPDIYRTENGLDSLRGRDDFRLLMMDMAMPADPLAHDR
jgi:eukaryotic-like serine/threonine-protein kinase